VPTASSSRRAVARVPRAVTAEQAARWAVGGAVVLALVLGRLEGGFAASRWAPAGIVLLWAALIAWALTRRRPPSRGVVVALGAYGLLTAWTLASVLWADTPGRALDAAGRTAVYGCALALALVPRWPRASLRWLLGLVGAGTVLLAALTLWRVVHAPDPSASFIDGRLIAPAGYVNAAAGLWTIALLPLVHLAAGGARHPVLRVAALVGAGLLLEVALLSQSRGATLALLAAAAVLVALTPRRGAVLLVLAAVGGAGVLAAPLLLDVRGAPSVALLAARLDRAGDEVLISLGALAVLGVAWQVALALLPPRVRGGLASPRTGLVATAATVGLLLVAVVATVGNPVTWAVDRADQALSADGYAGVPATGDRLTGSLGSNRGDMYRVALGALREHPVRGVGAEDFQPRYLRERRSTEAPRYAHSFPLGVLAGLGVVGGLLAFVALGTPVLLALRAMRGRSVGVRAGVAAALAGFAAWFAASAWDWTWEFPALTILAFLLLGAAARATDEEGAAPSAELRAIRERARAHGVAVPDDAPRAPLVPRTGRGRATALAVLAAALAASVVLAALGLASGFLRRGTALAASDPRAATLAFDRAARLNPLESDALLSRAIVARRLGDPYAWRADLRRALERSPDDWFARLQLGLALAADGQLRPAFVQLRRARELNPRQPAIQETIDALRDGERVDPATVEAQIAGLLNARLQPVNP
jgi:Flp pilus assembly protein TadD